MRDGHRGRAAMSSGEVILSVRDLVVEADLPDGAVRLIDGVSFDVHAHEVFGVVGESGSGKSITMLATMGLLPAPAVQVASGQIVFRGRDLLRAPDEALRALRGGRLGMIFQDPMTSLNPVLRIGEQIAEAIRIHNPGMPKRTVGARMLELLDLVGVPSAQRRARQFPHEFSGGMRQRAMIAMALANEPELLIADEPTTALDVTIQAQIMELLADIRARTGAAMILITHDLGVIAETADRVAVMYGGRILETARAEALFENPRHPYTAGLLHSLPDFRESTQALYSIPGQPPGVYARPAGCVFNPRCGLGGGRALCRERQPALLETGLSDHAAACHYAAETPAWAAATMQRDDLQAVEQRE